jgi:glucokinase
VGATIGGASIFNDGLLQGASHAAVDLGSICIERGGALCANGRRGCLDAYCGGEAFLMRARSYGINVRTPLEVWQAVDTNFAARSLCDDYIDRLAQGIGAAVSVLNPARLVCGGSLIRALSETLLQPLRVQLRHYCGPLQSDKLEVGAGQLGADAAVLGAVVLAEGANE